MELQEIKRNEKSGQGKFISVPMPDSWHSADYVALERL